MLLISVRSLTACSADKESVIWYERRDRSFLKYVTVVIVSMSSTGEFNGKWTFTGPFRSEQCFRGSNVAGLDCSLLRLVLELIDCESSQSDL